MRKHLIAVALLLVTTAVAQQQSAKSPAPALSPDVQQYVKFSAPVFALTHVRVIDGTGAAPKEDQTIVIDQGRIASLGPFASTPIPPGVQALEFRDYTVIPGLVGLHNHLYYTASLNREGGRLVPPGFFISEIPYTAPHLYVAAGVTTIRTTGSLEPYTDLFVKNLIDTKQMPGPKINATAPYLEGAGTTFPQMHPLTGPDDAQRFVTFWAQTGFTSWKAYMNITRDELRTAIGEIHKRGQKIAGHLCSVTWHEAAALGIDDLEHGPVYTATDFVPDKQPDKCAQNLRQTWAKRDINGPQVQGLIQDLIAHHVAVTSTLPVFEASLINRPPNPRALQAMSMESRSSFLGARALVTPEANVANTALMKKEMEFEHAFAKAGGLLLAGPDPTGNGGVLPGFGDWRELELLVEAGFTPVEAIHIYTQNGAQYLGESDRIGTIAPGKAADLVVIDGNPGAKIEDVEKTVVVFKDGVGYDSAKLFESVRGQVGIR